MVFVHSASLILVRSIVAGYMPGDLYNLNSAYGKAEELKQCIEEMHNNNLLVIHHNVSADLPWSHVNFISWCSAGHEDFIMDFSQLNYLAKSAELL